MDGSWRGRWERAVADGWVRPRAKPAPPPVKKKRGLPGSRLKAILAGPPFWIRIVHNGCKCEDRARLMDEWGVEGCRVNRDVIVGWLAESAREKGWPLAKTAAAILVDRAITLAAQDEAAE